MNNYEEKVQAKKEYYQQKANSLMQESKERYNKADSLLSQIPFGQPIMGSRDRNFREKQWAKMDKAFKVQEKAEYYQRKADSIGKAGISSDNPQAVELLKEKVSNQEKLQEFMKQANKYIKIKDIVKGDELLRTELKMNDDRIKKLREPDFCGRVGFPAYLLINNRQEITRLKKRIEDLESRKEIEENTEEIETELYTYKIEENRCQFIFDGKPNEEIRSILKNNGFKWSPSRLAWVRMANGNGIYASKRIMKLLESEV